MPVEDRGTAFGIVMAPEGATLEYTDRYMRMVEAQLLPLPERNGRERGVRDVARHVRDQAADSREPVRVAFFCSAIVEHRARELKFDHVLQDEGWGFNIRVKGRNIDVRVSTMPVQHGESVVMRLLNQSGGIHGRKISYTTLDDAFDVKQAVENTRKELSGIRTGKARGQKARIEAVTRPGGIGRRDRPRRRCRKILAVRSDHKWASPVLDDHLFGAGRGIAPGGVNRCGITEGSGRAPTSAWPRR